MVVEIDAVCLAAAAIPPEDEPPLTVDADRMEPGQIATQLGGWPRPPTVFLAAALTSERVRSRAWNPQWRAHAEDRSQIAASDGVV